MNGVIAGDRNRPVTGEVGDVHRGDVRCEAVNRWMNRSDPTAMLCNGCKDFVFVTRGDRDDDVLCTRTLHAVLDVRLRCDGVSARQNEKSREHQYTHPAAENHGLYYSKGSAMSSVWALGPKSRLNTAGCRYVPK